MKEDKLSTQSMDFAVSIIELVKFLKEKREYNLNSDIQAVRLPILLKVTFENFSDIPNL